ncbi:PREDICTED: endocuticle structural protein SgAbd-6-like [Ceratosolen solmsi marchali]|uniref:Endocuticle structural protein SgAbd-6-like n=1 Tax=Ceratosolen solmsi marchali TaxID=326594 RepID=A0AAJ6VME4_9HYME|nr:PREDICTED: endocuticle structural protein SgAbd-6-like [Ceratosolen solmsi marchali]
MKSFAIFLGLVAIVFAAPQRRTVNQPEVVLVKETPSDNIGLDGYKFAYELSDGSTREESAQVETRGVEDAVLRVRGSYSWVNPEDGQVYTVTYIADENGFQPQGAHLPVA